MQVYKTVDWFEQHSGKKISTQKVVSHRICDYTGEKIDNSENPDEYVIDFNDNDPCFGDGEGESWAYDFLPGYHNELFGQPRFVFKTEQGKEVFDELLNHALQMIEIYSLSHLLRWSRGRMLEKVIKSGQYKIDDFISE